MTSRFVALRRIVALFAAIALFAAPVASAQTPEAAPPKSAQSSAALLSPAAFARLVRPTPTTKGATSVVADSRRPSLLSQAKTLIAHQAQTAPTPAPQQRSWAARHKVATGILIGLGVGLGAWLIVLGKNGCFQDDSCSY